jgi:hypothetical protein
MRLRRTSSVLAAVASSRASSSDSPEAAACAPAPGTSAFQIPFKNAVDELAPLGVYSIPELAMVGMTEQQARERTSTSRPAERISPRTLGRPSPAALRGSSSSFPPGRQDLARRPHRG